MRLLEHGARVPELDEHQAAVRRGADGCSPDWDDLPSETKAAVQSALVQRQGGLCAYCMRRIRASGEGIRIEHYEARSHAPDLCFEWTNLLGVCHGRLQQERTCDARRGNRPLSIDPRREEHIAKIRYNRGRISASEDALHRDLDETLGLNVATLCRNREDALRGFLESLEKQKPDRTWPADFIRRKLAHLASRAELPEYFGVVEYWARKRDDRRR
ncbi:MAG: TIGR02646 family protein [Polyangiaceae bacterium]|nr:TIGR02646 family protein [Polyangiaceae bacterium]